jgi:hypothetical protein
VKPNAWLLNGTRSRAAAMPRRIEDRGNLNFFIMFLYCLAFCPQVVARIEKVGDLVGGTFLLIAAMEY